MTEAELVRAVCLDPDDVSLRLIYADFCEENGQPERAEFIRVQCELATASTQGQRQEALRHRERELTALHFCDWVPLSWHQGSMVGIRLTNGPYVEITGSFVQRATFHCGFVEEVHLKLADWYGETCGHCGGDGRHRWLVVRSFDDAKHNCLHCNGTGRIGEHGPAIVACQPIRQVHITDREPYLASQWRRPQLPVELWERCCKEADNGERNPNKRLSKACILWARQQAGLAHPHPKCPKCNSLLGKHYYTPPNEVHWC